MPWSPRPEEGAFSLLEAMIALTVLAVAAAALAIPLAAQLQLRRLDEARRQLDEARDAVLGFAAANGRLPCPATLASRGEEAFTAGADAATGRCADFHSGYLPGAALGLAPLDEAGFVRDPWQSPASRVRYAVHGGTINAVPHALTRSGGMQQATLAGLGNAPHYLYVCASGESAGPAGCGPAANQLTRRAAFVLLSPGANASLPAPAQGDEARNLDGDAAFVAREAREGGFDDLVRWGSIHLVVHRLVSAGRLP
jgi:type II secretory pathway pseudopilin PulG